MNVGELDADSLSLLLDFSLEFGEEVSLSRFSTESFQNSSLEWLSSTFRAADAENERELAERIPLVEKLNAF